jgi:predicted transcriptional regulator
VELKPVTEKKENVVPLRPKPAQETSRRSLEKRWTKGVIEPGFTFIPSVLLRAQARLHINAADLAVLMHLIDHWWEDEEMPFPSKRRLAERLSVSEKTVQRSIQRLEEAGLVRRHVRRHASGGQSSNLYDLTPLVEKLKPIAQDMLAARDEAAAKRRSAVRPGLKKRQPVDPMT